MDHTTTRSLRDMADLTTPMAIRVAATLGLAERAGTTGATAQRLAADAGADARALACLLDHLVTVGVFAVDDDGRYRATDLGGELVDEGLRRFLDINAAAGRADLAFVDLLGTVTTGEPAYPRRYGRDFWADLDAQPRLRRSFDAQMNWRYQVQAPQIAERFDWGRFTEILDVGGGDGTLLEAILLVHPGVRGRVVDLPPTNAGATERFVAAGLDDRASAIPGSFFDPLPAGADVYLLSDILHDWDDAHASAILDNCRRAAAPHGTVVVVEPVRGQWARTAMDLFMLMCFGGRERTVEELTALAAGVGLALRSSGPVAEGRSALEFVGSGADH